VAPLPWKNDGTDLPESKSVAMRRLKSIEKKMDANPEFGAEYCDKIDTYVKKGFARKLRDVEVIKEDPHMWYLPHFDVHNPNKPGKWRLVFDAASKANGVCLNDVLLQGPDLLHPLPTMLFGFRQKRIGLSGDIKDFFPRVWLRPEDAPAQRFLWRGMSRDKPPDVYEMSVLVFGAVSSPYGAQYIRNRNAERFAADYPEAVEGIVKKHYVDDYLDCANSEEEAVKLIQDVTTIHRKGGFEIVGWSCSSREVLNQLPEEAKSSGHKDLEIESSLPVARVLGLYWDPNEDIFTFTCKFNKVNEEIVSGNKVPTKREMLKLVMSVFDPLGFLSLFTVKAKILLQDVWRSKTGWDEEVTQDIFGKWSSWLEELKGITDLKIPRCYSWNAYQADSIQLHVFCDASEKAFAAVAYLRVEYEDQVDVSFAMGKTRVSPLKCVSIPRLELQSAVMAVRLADTIVEGHTLKIDEVHYWGDSKTVLYWIRSDSRDYKPFVSHRVGEIQEDSKVSNWHWVPTAENVADEATRDNNPCEFGVNSRWVNGPDFLKKSVNEWPKEKTDLLKDVDQDVLEKKTKEVTCLIASVDPAPVPDASKFSSFAKLIRCTAIVLRFIKLCRQKTPTNTHCREKWRTPVIQCRGGRVLRRSRPEDPAPKWVPMRLGQELLPQELDEAEKLVLKQSQWDSFPVEMDLLMKKKPVPSSSSVKTLSPYLEDGLMKLAGRTDKGKILGSGVKRPVILDPKNPVTRLLIHDYHVQAKHQGQERVVNDLRQKYWILNMRTAVKSSWTHCNTCKIRRAKPSYPEMGQLPEFRLEQPSRPFAVTGVDYFGPMEVTIGRRREKRYGVLFTCLSMRAVHLEIAASLTTDSCIMALRRFVARRGCPEKLYSDNGTNFHGASEELQNAIKELDSEKIQAAFSRQGMEWNFIPPSAPHMGGSWERLVRSVKTALTATLHERAPREEVLQTLFAEAEFTVNSRPLTHVSVDPDDPESLTPNHFLIGSSTGRVAVPGKFTPDDLWLRKQWRCAQRLADHFWKRWVKEFLPTLTKRTNWFKKTKPVEVGDLVFVADGNLPRNQWPRGLVTKVYHGSGGVRVVKLKTQMGSLTRPVVKICVLDVTEKVDETLATSTGGGMLPPSPSSYVQL
jgi:hypothetical protein